AERPAWRSTVPGDAGGSADSLTPVRVAGRGTLETCPPFPIRWIYLVFFQSGDRRFLEEQAGTAGLLGIDVIEHGAERVVVQLDGARTGPAADGPTRVVELDRVLHVPGLAIVAGDDEVNLVSARAWTG